MYTIYRVSFSCRAFVVGILRSNVGFAEGHKEMNSLHSAVISPLGGRIRHCLVLAILFISFSGNLAYAQQPSILAYTQVRNAANITQDGSGEPVPNDIGTRLLHAMMAESGLDYEIEIAPWARIIQYLETRPNILAYTLVRTEEREDLYHWIGLVTTIESHLYGLRAREADLPRTIEEARTYRVGSIRNDAYDNLLSNLEFSNVVHIANSAPWVELLQRGRLDMVPYGEQALIEYLQQNGLQEDIVVPLVNLEALSTGLYFAVSKQTEPELVERLRSAYQTVVDNGVYEEIMEARHPDATD